MNCSEPQMGSKPLSVSSFRQMCGRAGRLGLDTHGEAVLMIHSTLEQRLIAKRLLACELEPLQSSLHTANGGGLEKLLLELVCCGRLTHEEEVEAFVRCTLMNVQHERENVRTL